MGLFGRAPLASLVTVWLNLRYHLFAFACGAILKIWPEPPVALQLRLSKKSALIPTAHTIRLVPHRARPKSPMCPKSPKAVSQ